MPVIFQSYDLKHAKAIIDGRSDDLSGQNLLFYAGNHYQSGDGWIGPIPETGASNASAMLAEIERGFISRNVIKEVTDRHVAGTLGRECQWGFTPVRPMGTVESTDPNTGEPVTEQEAPTEQEQLLIDEAEAALTEWWDKREVPAILQDMVRLTLLAKRGPLRLYVPPGLRDASGNVPSGTLTESLERIYVQCLGKNEDTLDLELPTATVYTDKNSRQDIGVYVYQATDPNALPGDAGGEGEERAELCYLDDNGDTVLRITGGEGQGEEITLTLGRRLTLYEMSRPALISEQIISQQKALNLAESQKPRNAVLGGFLERVFLNVDAPTDQRYRVGAGTTNFLRGFTYTDEDGKTHVASPSVAYRDPVAPDTFITSAESHYANILKEANQLHYITSGEGNVSEESRKQARATYETDLQMTARKVEAATRWLLETTLALASTFSGRAGRYEELRATVQCRVDSGPVSAEERRSAKEMHDAGIWDLEYTQSMTGVEDVDAMNERIERERQTEQAPTVDDVEALLTRGQTQPIAPPPNGTEPEAQEA